MPVTQFPIPQYDYNQSPTVQSGPFSQYINGEAQYQNYAQPIRPGLPSSPAVGAGYLAKFMDGLQRGRAQSLIQQQAQESQDAQRVNDFMKGMEQQGYDPKDVAKMRQFFENQHVGYSLNNLADHGKQNPIAKAAHGMLSALAGGGDVNEKGMLDPTTGKAVKQKYVGPADALQIANDVLAGKHKLTDDGHVITGPDNGGGSPLQTMLQKHQSWARGTQPDGSDGFGSRMASAISDYRQKNNLPSDWQPTQEDFRLKVSPALAQEADAHTVEFGTPHPMAFMQTSVPRTQASDQTAAYLAKGPQAIPVGAAPPPTAPQSAPPPVAPVPATNAPSILIQNPFSQFGQAVPLTPIAPAAQ